MLYLIGLGLNERGITKEGLDAVSKCKRVYFENYTVNLPYTQIQIEEVIGKKIKILSREKVENLSLVDEAKKLNVALLIYGSPLSATTHITLINECKNSGVKYKVIYSSSIFDSIAETGLQIYKFGKTASMPAWQKSYEPDSFMEIVKENQSINAHSLILIDIGIDFPKALNQLKIAAKKHEIKINKLIICQALGTRNRKILYRNFEEAEGFSGVQKPYCIILPSKLHFLEKEILESYSGKK
ncbi:diphthine synthase [Candidatus Pacearchaeota archaeon]|nr:hypothetical protein [uncultured archaeon]MBS3084501.1 diphthine synthase [Candidatus Pacearchaeota archaeon]